jgi:putative ABC transport system permease protein
VIVERDAVARAGLLTFGSRARYQILLRLEEPRVAPLVTRLKAQFKNTFVSVRSFRTTEDDLGDDLLRAENYLSLVGLVVVVLGGIGISSVTRVFLEQKLRSIAVLKCVGAGTRQVLAVYVVQVTLLGFAGSLAGLGLGRLALAAAPDRLGTGPSALPLSHALTLPAMLQAIGIGVLVALLFSLVPLLRVRHVRPSLLLRHEESRASGVDWVRHGVTVLVVLGVIALAAWQAASVRIGVAVGVGFGVVVLVLYAAGWLLVRLTARLDRASSFALRHAVLHLHRPGNQTRLVLLAVGLGAFFIVGIRAVQVNLLREMAVDVGEDTPDMFLIDIQADQVAGVHALLQQRTGHDARVIPVLRARVTQVRGRDTSLDTIDDVRGRGSLAREYTITYRPHLETNERVLAGRFWDGTPSEKPEVSIEESIRERFKIDVGDVIRFTVLGQPIDATVTSVRHVNWRDSRAGGFIFVFRPGVLEDAPHGYIAPVRGPAAVSARARLQRDLVVAYPNVSVIDVREVLDTVRGVVSNVTRGIAAVGGLVLFTGVVILVGAVAMTKFRRVYEAAILKTLGASARLVGAVLLLEYGLLGTLAGVVGAASGSVLGWAITRYVIEIPWQLPLGEVLASVAATAVLVAVVGLVASADVLRGKPLATLRAE